MAETIRSRAKELRDADGQYMTFEVGNEVYAIHIRYLKEIVRYERPTPLPGAAANQLGIRRLRQQVVPIFSLATMFGLSGDLDSAQSCILIVALPGQEVGLAVDAVHEVVTIAAQDIMPPPPLPSDVRSAHLLGIAVANGVTRRLLNISQIIPSSEGASSIHMAP